MVRSVRVRRQSQPEKQARRAVRTPVHGELAADGPDAVQNDAHAQILIAGVNCPRVLYG
jgi:hypothetical protein